MRPRVPLAILFVATAGCIVPGMSGEACPAPEGWFVTGPFDHEGRTSMFDDAKYDRILFFGRNMLDGFATLNMSIDPPASAEAGSRIRYITGSANESVPANGTVMGSATSGFPSTNEGAGNHDLRLSLDADGCSEPGTLVDAQGFVPDPAGEAAYAGVGVMVRTAGFWHNGTLFYTNLARIHDDPTFERAGWYEYENDDPLPVYIYNQTRTEIPRRYNESGFVTTIPGFNEALKGIFVGTGRVAALTPEEAYTRPGNERHSLYGDPIVFYLEIVDVQSINCPLPQPACDVPTVPPPLENLIPAATHG